ncbi:MAG: MFS transporter [Tissierellia bacterium]|nr:MFS transporter [Tissierellia bacterium]
MADSRQNNEIFEWKYFLLLSTVPFFAVLTELAPTGVLSSIAGDLNVDIAKAGSLVGHYALAAAIFGIPLIAASVTMDRKKLLMMILFALGIFNLIVAFSTNFTLTHIARFLSGLSAGVMWPMIVAYGVKMTSKNHGGRAVAVIMAGSTIGMSLGIPLFTLVAKLFGWRAEFYLMGGLILLDMLLIGKILPSVPGEERTESNSLPMIIKNKGVLTVMLITTLVIIANYGVYVYIERMVDSFKLSGGISLAQLCFGAGSLVSVILVTKLIDGHLYGLLVGLFSLGVLSLLSFRIFRGTALVAHLSFAAWGMSYSSVSTLLQAVVSKQVSKGRDIATSLQSAMFNLSILIGTHFSGFILTETGGDINPVILMGIVFLTGGTIVAILSRKIIERDPA